MFRLKESSSGQLLNHVWDTSRESALFLGYQNIYNSERTLVRSLAVVNILGSQKCALSLDVPQTWFNNWPDDDSLSRNM